MTAVVQRTQPGVGRISTHREADGFVLRLVGEIDDIAVDAFGHASWLSSGAPATGQVIRAIDLSEVTFLSSSGVALLLRLTKPTREHGEPPLLLGLSRSAGRILTITGAISLFRTSA
jgi:anti-anti-sigma factor